MNNKTARKMLEMLYGKGCFFEKMGIRISKAKTLDHTITYHHIIPEGLGGKTTVQNGALLARYNHDWLHSQPYYIQDELNEQLKDFKASCNFARLIVREDGTIDFEKLDDVLIETTAKKHPGPIKVYDNSILTAEEIQKLKYIKSQKDYLEKE